MYLHLLSVNLLVSPYTCPLADVVRDVVCATFWDMLVWIAHLQENAPLHLWFDSEFGTTGLTACWYDSSPGWESSHCVG